MYDCILMFAAVGVGISLGSDEIARQYCTYILYQETSFLPSAYQFWRLDVLFRWMSNILLVAIVINGIAFPVSLSFRQVSSFVAKCI